MKNKRQSYAPFLFFALTMLLMAAREKDITVDIPQVDKKTRRGRLHFSGSVCHRGHYLVVSVFLNRYTGLDPNNPNSLSEFWCWMRTSASPTDLRPKNSRWFTIPPIFHPCCTKATALARSTPDAHITIKHYVSGICIGHRLRPFPTRGLGQHRV